MKIVVIRDVKTGQVLATAHVGEEGVPITPEAEQDLKIEELEVAHRELFDVEGFYTRYSK